MKAASPASPVQSAWKTVIRAVQREDQEAANLLKTSPYVQNAMLQSELADSRATTEIVQQNSDLVVYQERAAWTARASGIAIGGMLGTGAGFAIAFMGYDKVTGYMTGYPGLAKAVLPVTGLVIGGLTYALSTPDEPDSLAMTSTFYGLAGGLFVGGAIPAAQAALEQANATAPTS